MSFNYFSSNEYRKSLFEDIDTNPIETVCKLVDSYKDNIYDMCPYLRKAVESIRNTKRKNIERYYPPRDGAVVAIRIFYAEGTFTPMAELAFAFGGKVTVRWDMPLEREVYAPGINAYTVIYDERPKRPDFNDWVKQKC
jgi:hypothetical protein